MVADTERTDKTICLAVTPALRSFGVPSRPRLFEVRSKVAEINARRRYEDGGREGKKSCSARELAEDKETRVDFLTAPPRMSLYIKYSARIYGIYLKYIAPEDIHVYSIDEVFIDATAYLSAYRMTPEQLAAEIISDIFEATGITAAAGVGTNLYLAKVAMDIMAKRMPPDKNGARIASLDEESYRRELWSHRPLTDFWRVGGGYVKRLERYRIFTMGDIAAVSVRNEGLLYKCFGVNAELLIDHAWGWESCTLRDIKEYKPRAKSIGTGQVLTRPYTYSETEIIIREMCDALALELTERRVLASAVVLYIGYDAENLAKGNKLYSGEITLDHYGRAVPRHASGTANLSGYTSSGKLITERVTELFRTLSDKSLTVRRLNLSAVGIIPEDSVSEHAPRQLDIFTDPEELLRREREESSLRARERNMQRAVLSIKHKFGKNAIIKGVSLEESATAVERNKQIGGHKA